MDVEAACMAHANNTLIISYTKPKEILVFEGILKGTMLSAPPPPWLARLSRAS
jgi:hypothetical protein